MHAFCSNHRLALAATLAATFAVFGIGPAAGSPAKRVTLRVEVAGQAGVVHVKSARGTHNCLIDCSYSYAAGTALTVRATGAAPVTHFTHWSGLCVGTRPTCALTLRKDGTVVGTFKLNG